MCAVRTLLTCGSVTTPACLAFGCIISCCVVLCRLGVFGEAQGCNEGSTPTTHHLSPTPTTPMNPTSPMWLVCTCCDSWHPPQHSCPCAVSQHCCIYHGCAALAICSDASQLSCCASAEQCPYEGPSYCPPRLGCRLSLATSAFATCWKTLRPTTPHPVPCVVLWCAPQCPVPSGRIVDSTLSRSLLSGAHHLHCNAASGIRSLSSHLGAFVRNVDAHAVVAA